MVEQLESYPDKSFRIDDDNAAKLLLTGLGVIGHFATEFEGVVATNQTLTADCRTHHILALRFTGKAKKEDNGYIVYAMPKSKYTLDQMSAFYTREMAKLGIDSINIHSKLQYPESTPRN